MVKILCPNCKKHIYNLKKYPNFGDICDENSITPANNEIPRPKNGDEMICCYCGNAYAGFINMGGLDLYTIKDGYLIF